MKNLAILIGVADYQFINKLPPCNRDIDLISSILDISGKYQDTLLVNQSPTSTVAKEQIAEFVRVNQESEIDEIFIYYTGHGARFKDDFIYLFSDFTEQRLEQTSLRNSEFDAMLKSLKPKLTVKVIDACQAGTEYIKSNQELQLIFDKSSKESFNKAYFLFSSSSAESSMALQDFSVFTKSFAKSLLNFDPSQNIRYRDVMAYISDDINVTRHQTPLFIQQADNTEIFLKMTDELFSVIKDRIELSETLDDNSKLSDGNSQDLLGDNGSKELTPELLFVNKIKNKAKNFCNEDEVQVAISNFGSRVFDFSWNVRINDLFSIENKIENKTVQLDSKKDLAKWIFKSDEPYFTEIIYDDEAYKVNQKIEYEENSSLSSFFGRSKRTEYEPVIRYRKAINSYKLTAPSPIQTIEIKLEPKEEILSWYKIFITLIFSKSKLTIFYKYEIEKELNWTSRFVEEKNEWKTVHCHLKNVEEIQSVALHLMKDIENQIILDIQKLID
ncbi:caspase family protein [Acinetobacter bereziniae]|uniref:caspase family protein n=1 Tax=Acinetobacter bereziniae TaxID=106648 RepID=UPI0021CD779B|nr:caspase family protein [Acinetobacter bereziniae]MCU4535979.1 caspase family protein [Acinetobacter bereziniae]